MTNAHLKFNTSKLLIISVKPTFPAVFLISVNVNSFFQLLRPKALEAFMTHYFLSYPQASPSAVSVASIFKLHPEFDHNLTTGYTQVQSIIIFCLYYCNNLLTGFFTFTLAPFSIFSYVSKSDFVKTCQIMLPLCSNFSM